jgi:hypothetical protein
MMKISEIVLNATKYENEDGINLFYLYVNDILIGIQKTHLIIRDDLIYIGGNIRKIDNDFAMVSDESLSCAFKNIVISGSDDIISAIHIYK